MASDIIIYIIKRKLHGGAKMFTAWNKIHIFAAVVQYPLFPGVKEVRVGMFDPLLFSSDADGITMFPNKSFQWPGVQIKLQFVSLFERVCQSSSQSVSQSVSQSIEFITSLVCRSIRPSVIQ